MLLYQNMISNFIYLTFFTTTNLVFAQIRLDSNKIVQWKLWQRNKRKKESGQNFRSAIDVPSGFLQSLFNRKCLNRKQIIFKMGQPRPLFGLFSVFSSKHYNFLQQIYVKKCPSSIRCRDSNPRPSECESLPITTRPGLPPNNIIFSLSFFEIGFKCNDPIIGLSLTRQWAIGVLEMVLSHCYSCIRYSSYNNYMLPLRFR